MKFQGPAVSSVLLVIMATLNKPVVSACHVSAMATLTVRTHSHVTPELASVLSVSTTPKALHVLSVNLDTMGMLWPMTADVSDNSRYTSDSTKLVQNPVFTHHVFRLHVCDIWD